MEGSAIDSGLKHKDVIAMVNHVVVTSIVDGQLEPRMPVSSAISPTSDWLKFKVFRPCSASG